MKLIYTLAIALVAGWLVLPRSAEAQCWIYDTDYAATQVALGNASWAQATACAQTQQPPPAPTLPAREVPIPLPTQQMYEQMATANAILADAPVDLSRPENVPILPDENGRQMFGYIKWILSPAATDEWAGPFAPIFQHIGIGIALVFALMGVYGSIYIVANVGSWVAWLTDQARKLVDLVMQILQAGPMLLVLVALIFILFLLGQNESVQQWIDAQIDAALSWVYDILSKILGGL